MPAKYDVAKLYREIKSHDGKAGLATASGGKLVFAMNGTPHIVVMDERGNTANISTDDAYQSNGVISDRYGANAEVTSW